MVENPLNVGCFSHARIGGIVYRNAEDLPSKFECYERTGMKYAQLTDKQRERFMARIDELMRTGIRNYEIVNACESEGLTTDDNGVLLSRSRLNVIVWRHREKHKIPQLGKPRPRNSGKLETIKKELQHDDRTKA